jgi:predicted permease
MWKGFLSWRLLLRNRLFALTILFSLAIGMGSLGAAFSCFEVLFLRALPGVRGADRVLALATEVRTGSLLLPVSYPNYLDLRDQSTSFSPLAASQRIQVAFTDRGEAEQVRGEMVSASYFTALGVEPRLGRFFLPQEDRFPGAEPVVVLSEELWRRRFGADPRIVGRAVGINGRPYTVVGIAGGGFRGVDLLSRTELWVPLAMYRQVSSTPALAEQRDNQTLQLIGRLRPGITARRAAVEVASLSARLVSAFPLDNRDQRIISLSLSSARLRPKGNAILFRVSTFLIGIGALLLLVICSNVASLALVRALGRLDEFALRSSLGASRGQLLKEVAAEGLPLVLLALPLGLLATRAEIWLLWKFRPPFLPADLLLQPLDGRALALLLLVGFASGALLWLAPALQIRHLSLARAIRSRTDLQSGSDHAFSMRRLIVIAEVALSFVALSSSTYSLVRLRESQQVNPGFDTSRLLTVAFDLRGLDLTPPDAKQLRDRFRERVSALPGVQSVAYSSERLLGGAQLMHDVVAVDHDDAPSVIPSSLVEPEYFATVGITLRAGRVFSTHDTTGSPPVAIVNKTMANQLWPGGNAIGKRLLLDTEKVPLEVVGVVANSMLSGIDEVPHPFLYLPLSQRDSTRLALSVQVEGDPHRYPERLKRATRDITPGLPMGIEPVSVTLDQTLWWPRAMVGLLTLMSALTLFVAGTGLYGVTAYVSRRRRAEIGLRLALGARRLSIFGLIIREGLEIFAIGATLGSLAAFATAHWQAGPSWTALLTLASIAASGLLLLVVTLLAELLPALQAVRTEPSTVLKGSP